jgi:hypothetical protein
MATSSQKAMRMRRIVLRDGILAAVGEEGVDVERWFACGKKWLSKLKLVKRRKWCGELKFERGGLEVYM